MINSLKIKGLVAASAAAALMVFAAPAKAEYPEKPVEMTVLFGGTANTIAQLLSELMSEELGQPVVPVDRKGGGGAVGYSFLQSAAADGYNIVWNSNSINTSFHTGRIPFDYTAFTPIARVSVEIPALAVNSSTEWTSLDDMIAAANESGEKLRVGISGKGSFTHLTSAALFDAMGMTDQVIYISYGDGRAPVELLAGRIDAAIQWPGQFASYAETGELTVLAVTGEERAEVLSDVPTAQEQGFDVNITMWRGLAAPAGTPDEAIAALEEAARNAVESERFIEASQNVGFARAFLGHEAFGELIASDDAFYGELLTELGMAQ
ncbi:tripartite tricarboxylate transporter substrate binding protein [Octadecabacter sp. R77987]|uniref:tripartite tricarboxylate transporter substrate binding protein n=1 Tax=Octadecabacter sp. R77987 TaxID=3093874 RepID=UPI003671FC10